MTFTPAPSTTTELHVLDAGHFALDTEADLIAERIRIFLSTSQV